MINRRQWLYGVGVMAGAGMQVGALAEETPQNKPAPTPLDLSQYEPKSMLQVHESHVERAKFPVIDFHTHISVAAKSEKGVALSPGAGVSGHATRVLAVMDRKNMKAMVNLTGGYDKGLAEAVDEIRPGISWPLLSLSPNHVFALQRSELSEATGAGHRAGASRWCTRVEDSEDAWALPARKHHIRYSW